MLLSSIHTQISKIKTGGKKFSPHWYGEERRYLNAQLEENMNI